MSVTLLCNTFLWNFSEARKKGIINLFLSPRYGTYGKLHGEESDNGSEKKKEPGQVHSCGMQYLFVQGYC